jgi:hypothetical protein
VPSHPRLHLWEIARPKLRAPIVRGFHDIHALSAALNRPTQAALDALPPEPRPDGEFDEDAPLALTEPTPDPRVLDWACHEHLDEEHLPSYSIKLLVVPPGEFQVELWFAPMAPPDEDQVRELLSELGDQHGVEWAGTLPEPCEVAEQIDHAIGTIAEQALAVTGLPTDQLVDAYRPARDAALAGITTLLEYAARQGWTASRIVEAWELYCNDVEPIPPLT